MIAIFSSQTDKMPHEISMSGGGLWGFRISGGVFAECPCVISRITPGGKAAQANVMQGDVLTAVNGQKVNGMNLRKITKLIKDTGEELKLTLVAQKDIEESLKQTKPSKFQFPDATETAQTSIDSSLPMINAQPRPSSPVRRIRQRKSPLPISPLARSLAEPQSGNVHKTAPQLPIPRPRTNLAPCNDQRGNIDARTTEEAMKDNSDIKHCWKPDKPQSDSKPEVNWLRGKLKVNLKINSNALSDPGNKIKAIAQAHPNQPIEIECPLSATLVHAQYNTPVGLYSGNEIVNALVETATAKGALVTSSDLLGGNECVNVNRNTPAYKSVHDGEKASSQPKQSRSMKMLEAIVSQTEESFELN